MAAVNRVHRGVPCPKPGCKGVAPAQGTLSGVDLIVRYRVCQACGFRFKTTQPPEEIQEEVLTSESPA